MLLAGMEAWASSAVVDACGGGAGWRKEAYLRRSRRLLCAVFRSRRLCYPLHMSLKPLDDKNVMLRARLYRAGGDVVQHTEASYVSTRWEGVILV
jgi:hypothetical protein